MSKPNKVYGGIEWTPANIVTVIRILFIPVFVIALLMPWEQCLFGTDPMGLTVRAVVSLVVFGLICLTDTLDGYLARSRNEVPSSASSSTPLPTRSSWWRHFCALWS